MRDAFTRHTIEALARDYTVCPFEFSLDLSLWVDCIICDYNYAFDPRVYLRRFFLEDIGDYTFLVDEAHNLVDRAREMFSAELRKQPFLGLRRTVKGRLKKLYSAAGSLDKKLSVYNHAGTRLGTFTTRTAIGYNSVAVTNDGSLVVVVDDSAVYGLLRSSFIPETTPMALISATAPEPAREPALLPATTTRRITTMPTIPTPYPSPDETPEAGLSPAVPLTALGLVLLFFCRTGRP